MRRVRERVGLSGAGIAVTFSLLGHAGIALVASGHPSRSARASVVAARTVTTPATEFVIDEINEAPELPATPEAAATPSTVAREPVVREPVAREPVAPGNAPDAAPDPTAAAPQLIEGKSGPRFTMTVAPTTGKLEAVGVSPAPGPATGKLFGSPGSPVAGVPALSADTPAKLRTGSVPAYTPAALSAGVEANVPLEIVIGEAGNVTSARALEHVGYGLDEAALQSILRYRFLPALRSGKAIAVRMQWLMRFQLR